MRLGHILCSLFPPWLEFLAIRLQKPKNIQFETWSFVFRGSGRRRGEYFCCHGSKISPPQNFSGLKWPCLLSHSPEAGLTGCSQAGVPWGLSCGYSQRTAGAGVIWRLYWAAILRQFLHTGVCTCLLCPLASPQTPLSHDISSSRVPAHTHMAWVSLNLVITQESHSLHCSRPPRGWKWRLPGQVRAILGVSVSRPPYAIGQSTSRTPGIEQSTPSSDEGVASAHWEVHAGWRCFCSQLWEMQTATVCCCHCHCWCCNRS